MLHLGIVRLRAAASAGDTTTATVLARVVTTRALTAAALAVEATTSAARRITSARSVVAAAVGSRLGAARLHDDVLAVDNMGVGGDGGLVTLDGFVLDERAVLATG